MPIAMTRACLVTLTLGLLHGLAGSRSGSDDLVWYAAAGKDARTDGANVLYDASRRQARTPNS